MQKFINFYLIQTRTKKLLSFKNYFWKAERTHSMFSGVRVDLCCPGCFDLSTEPFSRKLWTHSFRVFRLGIGLRGEILKFRQNARIVFVYDSPLLKNVSTAKARCTAFHSDMVMNTNRHTKLETSGCLVLQTAFPPLFYFDYSCDL